MKETKKGGSFMGVLDNWERWKEFLGDKVDMAQDTGVDQNTIANLAYHIGDYLAKNVDPKNEQERVLSDLWKAANEEEQKAIANVMVKLVQKEH